MIRNLEEDARAVLAEISKPRARVECYARLIAEVKECFAAYAIRNPERAGDERFTSGLECSILGIGAVLEILDDYEIGYKRE